MLGSIKYLLLDAVSLFFRLLQMLIFARIILSWLPINHDNPISRLIYQLTEPILAPARAMLERSPLGGRGMMLDFSPIIAYFLLQILESILRSLIALL